MEKRKLTLLQMPTGAGKSYQLRHRADIIAVPTVALAKEQEREARKEGKDPLLVLGRRHFLCPAKLSRLSEEEKREIEKYLNEDGTLKEECPTGLKLKILQDYLCCRRRGCEGDPFSAQFQKGGAPVICTHAFLVLAPFVADKGYLPQGAVLGIDEADLFLRELEKPQTFLNAMSQESLVLLIRELMAEKFIARKKGESLLKKVEKGFSLLDRGMFAVRVGNTIRNGNAHTPHTVRGLGIIESVLEEIHLALKNVKGGEGYKDLLIHLKTLLEDFRALPADGSYSYVRDREIAISQLLFSRGMWLKLSAAVSALEPREVILATATVPKPLLSLFPERRWEINIEKAPECVTLFPNSEVVVGIGYREYDYENIASYREYALDFITRFLTKNENGVVLTTSYEDIEWMSEALKERGYRVIAQEKEGNTNGVEKALELFRSGWGGVLIGNISLWRGLNITTADKFFIYKLPFPHPEDPKGQAFREYSQMSRHFAIAREEAKHLLSQGIGRVVREDGVKKCLFILDRRILYYHDMLSVVGDIPSKVYVLLIREEDVNA